MNEHRQTAGKAEHTGGQKRDPGGIRKLYRHGQPDQAVCFSRGYRHSIFRNDSHAGKPVRRMAGRQIQPEKDGRLALLSNRIGKRSRSFYFKLSTCLYTPVAEGRIPIAMTGTVMGVASAIGYSSDIWLYNLCGRWLDKLGNAGYTNIWYFTAAGGLMMIVMAMQLNK